MWCSKSPWCSKYCSTLKCNHNSMNKVPIQFFGVYVQHKKCSKCQGAFVNGNHGSRCKGSKNSSTFLSDDAVHLCGAVVACFAPNTPYETAAQAFWQDPARLAAAVQQHLERAHIPVHCWPIAVQSALQRLFLLSPHAPSSVDSSFLNKTAIFKLVDEQGNGGHCQRGQFQV